MKFLPRRDVVLNYGIPLLGFFLACLIVLIGPRAIFNTLGVGVRAMSDRALSTIYVIDGDTVAAGGKTYRLVGFDTPEAENRARCEAERTLGARAKARLSILAADPSFKLRRVTCAWCKSDAEGTPACNAGRLCAVAFQNGRDVAAIMIGNKLARPFTCTNKGCPRLYSWCDVPV